MENIDIKKMCGKMNFKSLSLPISVKQQLSNDTCVFLEKVGLPIFGAKQIGMIFHIDNNHFFLDVHDFRYLIVGETKWSKIAIKIGTEDVWFVDFDFPPRFINSKIQNLVLFICIYLSHLPTSRVETPIRVTGSDGVIEKTITNRENGEDLAMVSNVSEN